MMVFVAPFSLIVTRFKRIAGWWKAR
jgi:hypothetical protein